jgi:hypothetical protein
MALVPNGIVSFAVASTCARLRSHPIDDARACQRGLSASKPGTSTTDARAQSVSPNYRQLTATSLADQQSECEKPFPVGDPPRSVAARAGICERFCKRFVALLAEVRAEPLQCAALRVAGSRWGSSEQIHVDRYPRRRFG